ncbi:hypothetical protein GDO86_002262 [Hymenochirus boettgeri]|uniref:THAP-type domain-containing protein n=1 Tax=Hymenochirus boettgeri TaxID=247094 RepID=A0A8T2KJC9_9PIPI|nr:hypothetical protein GDO86_002262 [Hymenochirus boettgeri]KAG8456412.1 hypothetical protein GDO86_002262 [Hymenochirus boettgeri]
MSQKVLDGKKNEVYRLCSSHFTEDCYMINGNKRILKPSAVPTIFPNTSFQQPLHTVTTIHPLNRPGIQSNTEKASILHLPTASTVVRIVSRLRSVHTQTDVNVFQHDQYCNTEHWFNKKNACTQTASAQENDQLLDDANFVAAHTTSCASSAFHTTPLDRRFGKKTRGSLFGKRFSDTILVSPISQKTAKLDDVGDTSSEESFQEVHDSEDIPYEPSESTCNTNVSFQYENQSCENRNYLSERAKRCNASITDVTKYVKGSMIAVRLTCEHKHQSLFWRSQPMENNIAVGNVQMAASILYSGSSFTKVSELFSIFGILAISQASYCHYQKSYLFPAIDYEWQKEVRDIQSNMHDKAIVVAGDCTVSRPIKQTKFCTYTLMDALTKKIVHFSIDQFGPGKTMDEIKKTTFETCLDGVLKRNADVKIIATDRHDGIRKLVSTKYSHLSHQFDVRHICKSLKKRIVTASRLPGCAVLAKWVGPIIKHLWFITKTCNCNADLLIAKWLSLLHHIRNKHRFPSNSLYKKCEHKRLSELEQKHRPWFKETDKAYQQLCSIVNAPQLLNDLRHSNMLCHTADMEVYRNKMLKFRPKCISDGMDAMRARAVLSALSHNRNCNREQATIHCPKIRLIDLGGKCYNFPFKKQTKQRVAKPKMKDDHVRDIMRNTIDILSGEIRTERSPLSQYPVNIAAGGRPD